MNMKIKILRGDRGKWYCNTDNIGKEFGVKEYYDFGPNRFELEGGYWVDKDDCVITELPESFCVKRCDDRQKWKKYIKWLNKTYNKEYYDNVGSYYGCDGGGCWAFASPIGTEIHIDDIIKHIDFYSEPMVIESKEEFDMNTNEGRQAYAIKYYPIGTKYLPIDNQGNLGRYHETLSESISNPRWFNPLGDYIGIECGVGYIYANNKWAEIIKDEFDMTTNEGRLDYAKKYFTIGTKYIPRHADGSSWERECEIIFTPVLCIITGQIEGGRGYIYSNGKWAELIKEEKKMETQKLSRQGLKEIHSIACSNWKVVLERYGANSPLEDYIELTQEQVNNMFKACTKEQLPIVSKYLKQDDGSVDLSNIKYDESGARVDGIYILRHDDFDASDNNSFWLNNNYDWILKVVKGDQRLYPTKKKSTCGGPYSYGGPYGTASGVSQEVGSNTATIGRMDL